MKAVQYYRLMKGEKVVGFKRVTTEYIDMADNKWKLESISYDSEIKLSTLPLGLNRMKRARLPNN